MALNWNLTEVADFKKLHAKPGEGQITDSVIWGTMFVGISKITEANWREFYARYHLLELLDGGFMSQDGKPRYIKPGEVQRRIGLSTNAQDWTRPQFIKIKVTKRLDEYSREEV